MNNQDINCRPLIEAMRQEMQKGKKLTLENFLMPEASEDSPAGPQSEPQPSATVPERGVNMQMAADKLNQIRRIALEGVRELADDPTSEAYIMFKKIWNMCDKASESGNNKSQEGSEN